MKVSLRALLTALVFCLGLGGCFLAQVISPPPSVLTSERRQPADPPKPQSIGSADWMDRFERYAADRFFLREPARRLRAGAVLGLFAMTDKDGLYLDPASGSAGKFEAIDSSSAAQFAETIARLAAGMPEQRVYYAVVPDKSWYAARRYPGYDPARLREILVPKLSGLTEIDLTGALTLRSYYRTDLHWDQRQLGSVVQTLGEAMGISFASPEEGSWREAGAFLGVYPGQLALPLPPDTMTYWGGGAAEDALAQYLDPRTAQLVPGVVYDLEKFVGRDPYDLFLCGAQPLVVLENPSAVTERELFLFRDSFGSNLAPLLLSGYRRVTLIDLRLINARALPEFFKYPDGADVLFLYSTQIINHAGTLMT
ncbi:MAG: hypothetical protein LBJ11_10275 [Oscillospiraceae bacterium]|jgi:hypothetical protein|nr:hypothetical protein [Oscillospiraceae bacterium]